MAKLNKNEESLLKKVRDICCPDGELEIDHMYVGDTEGITADGWYPYTYFINRSEAVPFEGKDFVPVMTDEEAKKKNIDVRTVLSKAGCYYVG